MKTQSVRAGAGGGVRTWILALLGTGKTRGPASCRNQEPRLHSSWLGWGDDSVMWHRVARCVVPAFWRFTIGGIRHGETLKSSLALPGAICPLPRSLRDTCPRRWTANGASS